jgi:hypothetical protein
VTVMWRVFKSRGAYINVQGFERSVRTNMEQAVGPLLLREHEAIVKDWKRKPQFAVTTRVDVKGISVTVAPMRTSLVARVWFWLTYGVKGKWMTPLKSHGKAMMWRATGAQHASLNRVGKPSNARGLVFTKRFWWPGIRARHFEVDIARRVYPEFRRQAENILRRAVRAARLTQGGG